ncbi:GTPase IMAP family member 9-like [Oncorhynchus clarkii lewisi]|uniref:GTPase IMAP family member 9-like n=1 Tax=Oncorhynchus clarkii lewisi TaxID=490388 RepID=UPI0039B99C39
MLGWVFVGRSAAGNAILNTSKFEAGRRSVKFTQQSAKFGGRQVTVVDTPGWWTFFLAEFTSPLVKSEILKGVSLGCPFPNAALLMIPVDTAFTEEQRKVTQDNMKLLGEGVWRHTIVVFTWGACLGDTTIEQHIESEGKALHWLIEKCGNRYHVFDSKGKDTDAQVKELLEKIEEMVAGKHLFCLSTEIHKPVETGIIPRADDEATEKISQLLNQEWDRRNWEILEIAKTSTPPILKGNRSMPEPYRPDCGQQLERLQSIDLEVREQWKELLEKEWSRREIASQLNLPSHDNISEPDADEPKRSRHKVLAWLKSSGYRTASTTSMDGIHSSKTEDFVTDVGN